MNCGFCNTWQHLHCYGYLGSDDPRVPDIHACYRCLLQEKEAPLLRELQDLALLRKGVHIIQVDGYFNDRKFSEALRKYSTWLRACVQHSALSQSTQTALTFLMIG